MIATLPMYDWPEVREATDAWWAGLARHLREAGFEAPDRLTRAGRSLDESLPSGIPHPDPPPRGGREQKGASSLPSPQSCAGEGGGAGGGVRLARSNVNSSRSSSDASAAWRRPELLVSQTCGFPLMHGFRDRLEVLATPVYDVDGCSGASYSSLIVVPADGGVSRLEDLEGATAAYNATDSLSGHLALKCVFAPLSKDRRFFGQLVQSGGHGASMQLVCDRKADVAAIDCVSFALARRHRPELAAGLAVIARGPAAPALPYVTAAGRPAEEIGRLKHALSAAAADPALAVARQALFIAGLEFLAPDAYHRVLDLEAECDALGYATLA